MIYFAYGSNINLDHFTEYLDTHGVTIDTELGGHHALLHNFRLRTNYFASSHGAGACNIEPKQDEYVEGVLWTITPAAQDALRLKEGFPYGCHPSYGNLVPFPAGLAPAEHACLTWTHNVVTRSRANCVTSY